MINLAKTKNDPNLDRSHRLSRGFSRVVHYDIRKSSPLESLTVAYGNGVMRFESSSLKNKMFFQCRESKEFPLLEILEQYHESVMVSFKSMKAEGSIDVFAGVRGMNKIRILDAKRGSSGTTFRFTNFLVPWELSEHGKASWRKANLVM